MQKYFTIRSRQRKRRRRRARTTESECQLTYGIDVDIDVVHTVLYREPLAAAAAASTQRPNTGRHEMEVFLLRCP